ncbi:tetratricopeptide repeat protein [Chitinophaga vietnamensis]|nr:tetratricopeptide repeat protein [Chitinophaga vietnamensis]
MGRVRIIILTMLLQLAAVSLFAQRSGLVSSDVLYKMALEARNEQKDYPKAIKLCKKALAQSPDYTDIRILLGRLYEETGQYIAAKHEWNTALKTAPGNEELLHALINLYDRTGNKEEALCYVDMLLEKHPRDKDLLLKRYGIAEAGSNVVEQAKTITLLRTLYPNDPQVKNVLHDYQLSAANMGNKSGNRSGAVKMYEQVLLRDSVNTEALQGIAGSLEALGRPQEALPYYERLHRLQPAEETWMLKISSILFAARQYKAALPYAEALYRKRPSSATYKQHLADVYAALLPTDSTAVYASPLVNLQPANRDAYIQLINQAYRQRDYTAANDWCNKALQRFPGDEEIWRKQIGIQEAMPNTALAAATALKLWQQRPSAVNQQIYTDLQLAHANKLMRAHKEEEAAQVLQQTLKVAPGQAAVLLSLSNLKALQGKPQEALTLLDRLLAKQPADTALLFKKAGLLEAMQQYAAAAAVSRELLQRYPQDTRYRQAYTDQLLAAARQHMQLQQYDAARPLLEEVLQQAPGNREAWSYLVNLDIARNQPGEALASTYNALQHFNDDSLFLQKRSALLQQTGNYADAYTISGRLHQRYPSDTTLRNMYLDQLLAHGKQLRDNQRWDSAWQLYQTAYSVAPKDTTVLQNLVGVAFARKQYDTALAYADKGLAQDAHNTGLLEKKAGALEQLRQYGAAANVARQLYALQPEEKKWRNYADQLASHSYRNQAGIIYMQSVYDKDLRPGSILSLQYLHRYDRGSIIGRINYGSREAGNGVQLEAETYYKHNPRYYSYGLLGWSPSSVFPRVRAGYSLFRNFNKEWEGELGARYIRSDSMNNYSIVASVAKTWGSYWVNLRGFATTDEHQWYQAYVLTNRFYMRERQDFLALIGSIGASPDDRSRNFQFGRVAGFTSTSLTAGYQRTIRGRATAGLYGTWTRQQTGTNLYMNQYDIYALFLWNF